jgi:serine/threonine-protein kinase RsbW
MDRPVTSSRPPRRVELRVESHPANLAQVRKTIERFAAEQGFDDRAVAEIGLVVNEAMANVIRHAYAGRTDRPVHLEAEADDGQLVIRLRDWGSGVDPTKQPSRERDPLTPGGVGMICLRQWMDNVTYTPQRDGMLMTMVRKKK